jgi:hypothetical protein
LNLKDEAISEAAGTSNFLCSCVKEVSIDLSLVRGGSMAKLPVVGDGMT